MSGALESGARHSLVDRLHHLRRHGHSARHPWRAAHQPFQIVTQPFWIVLNILPFIFIALMDWEKYDLWRAFAGIHHASGPPVALWRISISWSSARPRRSFWR